MKEWEKNDIIYVYDEKETNKEECEKYADIECESSKGFFENPNFIYGGNDSLINSELSNIKFYKVISHIDSYTSVKDYTFAITTDGKIYTNYK